MKEKVVFFDFGNAKLSKKLQTVNNPGVWYGMGANDASYAFDASDAFYAGNGFSMKKGQIRIVVDLICPRYVVNPRGCRRPGPLSFGFFNTCLEGWSADSCRLSVVLPSATGYAGVMAFKR